MITLKEILFLLILLPFVIIYFILLVYLGVKIVEKMKLL